MRHDKSCNNRKQKEILGLKSQKKRRSSRGTTGCIIFFQVGNLGDFLEVPWDKLYLNLANSVTLFKNFSAELSHKRNKCASHKTC